jgi:hypothetical protein
MLQRFVFPVLLSITIAVGCVSLAAAAELQFKTQEIDKSLGVGYAVSLVDINADNKLDIVVVDKTRVIWFENPTWKLHTLIQGQTRPDNVCISANDVDGDGQVDLALGADWRPSDTKTGGTIQWLSRQDDASAEWKVYPIGTEPTVHRMRWADLDNDGRSELVVVPLMGRNTTPPHFAESPIRVLAFKVPTDPRSDTWQPTVLSEQLHVAHNLFPTDLDRDGKTDLLVASFEGVTWLSPTASGPWKHHHIGAGNQETMPNRGASEIKHGRLGSGLDYVATIEPWHGFQVVVYTPPEGAKPDAPPPVDKLWTRLVLDEQLVWGHAVWCANLDDDADQELVIGVRDKKSDDNPSGIRIYDPSDNGQTWKRQLIDPAGVAVEDATAGDLDGNGRTDIVAVGRATKNVRIYWNQGK